MGKRIQLKIISAAILMFALVSLAGCAGVNESMAGKLADKGASAVKTIGESYQATSDDLNQYVETEYLLAGLKPGYSKPSDSMLESIDTIKKELNLRKQMFTGLNDVYVSFGALCAYDAKGEVEKSVGNTVQAGNSLAAHFGSSISDPVGKLFATASGGIAGQFQADRIKDASAKIRSLLQGIIVLLEKQKEEAAIISIRKEISERKLEIGKYFWEKGYASAEGILNEDIQVYGLTPDTAALKKASQDKSISAAIGNVLTWRQKQEEDSQAAAYHAAIQTLRTLINEHAKIEAGEPVNLEAIQGYMATVQQYVDLMTAVKKGK